MTLSPANEGLYPRRWEMLLLLALVIVAAWPSAMMMWHRLAAWVAFTTFGAYLFQRMPEPDPERKNNKRDLPPDPIGNFIYNMVTGFIILFFMQGVIGAVFISYILYNLDY